MINQAILLEREVRSRVIKRVSLNGLKLVRNWGNWKNKRILQTILYAYSICLAVTQRFRDRIIDDEIICTQNLM